MFCFSMFYLVFSEIAAAKDFHLHGIYEAMRDQNWLKYPVC